jgi:seryl-tRNA(Sec) selenium transferase
MKPTKEALAGILAALQCRAAQDPQAWQAAQEGKVQAVLRAALHWPGITAHAEPDPQGNGFERLWLTVDATRAGVDAGGLAQRLRDGDPVIAVAPHRLAQGRIGLELTGVAEAELPLLCDSIARALQSR